MLCNKRGWCLAILLLTTAACGGGEDGHGDTKVVERFTLAGFRQHQEEHCTRLADKLNKPVHWHIVVDNSKSYSPPQTA